MKILCVIDSLGSGGAQRQLVNLAIGFKGRGHDVSFLTYHSHDFYSSFLEEARISITTISHSNYLVRLLKMRKHIRNGNYNVVLSFLDGPNFICEIAGFPWRNWRLVVGERSADPKMLKSFKLRLYRWFHLLADYVVANSHENIEMVKRINPFLPSHKCKVIYNIVDFERWKPSENYIFRKNNKFKIVVAASHQYLKNLNGLVEGVNLLDVESKNNLLIEWYGDEADNSMQEAFEKINNYKLTPIFNFYPATLSITKKMQYADVIGLFSFYEGFPNTICEGMSCGKPIVCSKVSDLSNIVPYDDKLLFSPNDSSSIMKSLSYVINLSEEKLKLYGDINIKIAEENFEKENILKQYIQLFKNGKQ